MVWLSDNSSLSALAEMSLIDLLPTIYGKVHLTQSVLQESQNAGAPLALRKLTSDLPNWLILVPDPAELLLEVQHLGQGEATSITLAKLGTHPTTVILDERKARSVARQLGVPHLGVVGILEEAAALKLVKFETAVAQLRHTGFHLSERIVKEVQTRLSKRPSS